MDVSHLASARYRPAVLDFQELESSIVSGMKSNVMNDMNVSKLLNQLDYGTSLESLESNNNTDLESVDMDINNRRLESLDEDDDPGVLGISDLNLESCKIEGIRPGLESCHADNVQKVSGGLNQDLLNVENSQSMEQGRTDHTTKLEYQNQQEPSCSISGVDSVNDDDSSQCVNVSKDIKYGSLRKICDSAHSKYNDDYNHHTFPMGKSSCKSNKLFHIGLVRSTSLSHLHNDLASKQDRKTDIRRSRSVKRLWMVGWKMEGLGKIT